MCVWNRIFAALKYRWTILSVLKASWSEPPQWFCQINLVKVCLSTYTLQRHLLKALCLRLKRYLRRLKLYLRRLGVFEPSWAVLKALEGVLEQAKTFLFRHTSIKNLSLNYTLQQHLLEAPCVHLKPYLRCLEMSLNRLERLENALKQLNTVILLSTPIKNMSFKPIRCNNTLWRRLVRVWNRMCAVLKCHWAVLSRLEGILEQAIIQSGAPHMCILSVLS